MGKVWKIKEPDLYISQKIASELDIPPIIAKLLVNRGITDPKEAELFLYPSISGLHPPEMMKGIPEAVSRIQKAIDDHEKIWIHGDYDVDGITSVSLLTSCLRHIGADVDYYIPHRIDDGYGLHKEGLAELKSKGCDLIITADCGITSVDEVSFANSQGMDVIITDHHQPFENLPPALVIIDPKLGDCGYPYDGLAGVGVAFKLAQAIMEKSGAGDFLMKQLDLVALGTVADVVPLYGENRIIVKSGLEIMNNSARAGIRALCEVGRIEPGTVDSSMISFRLAPRINASGRMDTAYKAVSLMTTDSYEEALSIAQKLDSANKERQDIERYIMESAKKKLKQLDLSREKCLVLAEKGWHRGVIGIAASKIQELCYRPIILISMEEDAGHGSARSIPEFDIFCALKKCSHLLTRFGGHRIAAGLSLPLENIDEFRRELSKMAEESLTQDDLQPKVEIDAAISLSDLTEEAVEKLSMLQPCGLGNPEPLFAIKGLSAKEPKVVGKNSQHLKMIVSDGKLALGTIAFNMSGLVKSLNNYTRLDIIVNPQINVWNNERSVELKIEDVAIRDADSPEAMIASAETLEQPQLKIKDLRNIPDKKRYIRKLLLQGEKAIMYVRDDIAVNQLQKIISYSTPSIETGLCYLTTPEDDIDLMKSTLIDGKLNVIISSIPFEEPLSGLKHIVFCHPVPTRDRFISCCAPAVESSEPVSVHLIFNNSDIDSMTKHINAQYPDRRTLANVYKKIKWLYDYKKNPVHVDDVLSELGTIESKEIVFSNSIAIFEEIKIVEQQKNNGKITLAISADADKRHDLKESMLYSEGDKIRKDWVEFSDFLMKKSPADFIKMLIESY